MTVKQVIEIYESTESRPALARKYGIAPRNITGIKTGEHWKPVTQGLKRGRYPGLTEADVLEIYTATGKNNAEIGARYGVSGFTVTKIKAGINWAWLTGGGR